jgi:hypothetical protein
VEPRPNLFLEWLGMKTQYFRIQGVCEWLYDVLFLFHFILISHLLVSPCVVNDSLLVTEVVRLIIVNIFHSQETEYQFSYSECVCIFLYLSFLS